jgi:predicted esterase
MAVFSLKKIEKKKINNIHHYNLRYTKSQSFTMSINVLCLHGCNQTEEAFKGYLKGLTQLAKKYDINFHFCEAKYDHPDLGKTWYNKPLFVKDIGTIEYDEDLVGYTLENINQLIGKLDISCLLGFSQGSNVVDTYLGYTNDTRIKCAVMLSGYYLVDSNRKVSDVPILNVISKDDDVVKYELAPKDYKSIEVLDHNKGHKIPTSKPQLREILAFIRKHH